MPHSTATNSVAPSSPAKEDTVLLDAPPHALDEAQDEGEEADDIDRQDKETPKEAPKSDIKLEDLYNDDDDEEDDEEFPSSGVFTEKVESNPPAAPL